MNQTEKKNELKCIFRSFPLESLTTLEWILFWSVNVGDARERCRRLVVKCNPLHKLSCLLVNTKCNLTLSECMRAQKWGQLWSAVYSCLVYVGAVSHFEMDISCTQNLSAMMMKTVQVTITLITQPLPKFVLLLKWPYTFQF